MTTPQRKKIREVQSSSRETNKSGCHDGTEWKRRTKTTENTDRNFYSTPTKKCPVSSQKPNGKTVKDDRQHPHLQRVKMDIRLKKLPPEKMERLPKGTSVKFYYSASESDPSVDISPQENVLCLTSKSSIENTSFSTVSTKISKTSCGNSFQENASPFFTTPTELITSYTVLNDDNFVSTTDLLRKDVVIDLTDTSRSTRKALPKGNLTTRDFYISLESLKISPTKNNIAFVASKRSEFYVRVSSNIVSEKIPARNQRKNSRHGNFIISDTPMQSDAKSFDKSLSHIEVEAITKSYESDILNCRTTEAHSTNSEVTNSDTSDMCPNSNSNSDLSVEDINNGSSVTQIFSETVNNKRRDTPIKHRGQNLHIKLQRCSALHAIPSVKIDSKNTNNEMKHDFLNKQPEYNYNDIGDYLCELLSNVTTQISNEKVDHSLAVKELEISPATPNPESGNRTGSVSEELAKKSDDSSDLDTSGDEQFIVIDEIYEEHGETSSEDPKVTDEPEARKEDKSLALNVTQDHKFVFNILNGDQKPDDNSPLVTIQHDKENININILNEKDDTRPPVEYEQEESKNRYSDSLPLTVISNDEKPNRTEQYKLPIMLCIENIIKKTSRLACNEPIHEISSHSTSNASENCNTSWLDNKKSNESLINSQIGTLSGENINSAIKSSLSDLLDQVIVAPDNAQDDENPSSNILLGDPLEENSISLQDTSHTKQPCEAYPCALLLDENVQGDSKKRQVENTNSPQQLQEEPCSSLTLNQSELCPQDQMQIETPEVHTSFTEKMVQQQLNSIKQPTEDKTECASLSSANVTTNQKVDTSVEGETEQTLLNFITVKDPNEADIISSIIESIEYEFSKSTSEETIFSSLPVLDVSELDIYSNDDNNEKTDLTLLSRPLGEENSTPSISESSDTSTAENLNDGDYIAFSDECSLFEPTIRSKCETKINETVLCMPLGQDADSKSIDRYEKSENGNFAKEHQIEKGTSSSSSTDQFKNNLQDNLKITTSEDSNAKDKPEVREEAKSPVVAPMKNEYDVSLFASDNAQGGENPSRNMLLSEPLEENSISLPDTFHTKQPCDAYPCALLLDENAQGDSKKRQVENTNSPQQLQEEPCSSLTLNQSELCPQDQMQIETPEVHTSFTEIMVQQQLNSIKEPTEDKTECASLSSANVTTNQKVDTSVEGETEQTLLNVITVKAPNEADIISSIIESIEYKFSKSTSEETIFSLPVLDVSEIDIYSNDNNNKKTDNTLLSRPLGEENSTASISELSDTSTVETLNDGDYIAFSVECSLLEPIIRSNCETKSNETLLCMPLGQDADSKSIDRYEKPENGNFAKERQIENGISSSSSTDQFNEHLQDNLEITTQNKEICSPLPEKDKLPYDDNNTNISSVNDQNNASLIFLAELTDNEAVISFPATNTSMAREVDKTQQSENASCELSEKKSTSSSELSQDRQMSSIIDVVDTVILDMYQLLESTNNLEGDIKTDVILSTSCVTLDEEIISSNEHPEEENFSQEESIERKTSSLIIGQHDKELQSHLKSSTSPFLQDSERESKNEIVDQTENAKTDASIPALDMSENHDPNSLPSLVTRDNQIPQTYVSSETINDNKNTSSKGKSNQTEVANKVIGQPTTYQYNQEPDNTPETASKEAIPECQLSESKMGFVDNKERTSLAASHVILTEEVESNSVNKLPKSQSVNRGSILNDEKQTNSSSTAVNHHPELQDNLKSKTQRKRSHNSVSKKRKPKSKVVEEKTEILDASILIQDTPKNHDVTDFSISNEDNPIPVTDVLVQMLNEDVVSSEVKNKDLSNEMVSEVTVPLYNQKPSTIKTEIPREEIYVVKSDEYPLLKSVDNETVNSEKFLPVSHILDQELETDSVNGHSKSEIATAETVLNKKQTISLITVNPRSAVLQDHLNFREVFGGKKCPKYSKNSKSKDKAVKVCTKNVETDTPTSVPDRIKNRDVDVLLFSNRGNQIAHANVSIKTSTDESISSEMKCKRSESPNEVISEPHAPTYRKILSGDIVVKTQNGKPCVVIPDEYTLPESANNFVDNETTNNRDLTALYVTVDDKVETNSANRYSKSEDVTMEKIPDDKNQSSFSIAEQDNLKAKTRGNKKSTLFSRKHKEPKSKNKIVGRETEKTNVEKRTSIFTSDTPKNKEISILSYSNQDNQTPMANVPKDISSDVKSKESSNEMTSEPTNSTDQKLPDNGVVEVLSRKPCVIISVESQLPNSVNNGTINEKEGISLTTSYVTLDQGVKTALGDEESKLDTAIVDKMLDYENQTNSPLNKNQLSQELQNDLTIKTQEFCSEVSTKLEQVKVSTDMIKLRDESENGGNDASILTLDTSKNQDTDTLSQNNQILPDVMIKKSAKRSLKFSEVRCHQPRLSNKVTENETDAAFPELNANIFSQVEIPSSNNEQDLQDRQLCNSLQKTEEPILIKSELSQAEIISGGDDDDTVLTKSRDILDQEIGTVSTDGQPKTKSVKIKEILNEETNLLQMTDQNSCTDTINKACKNQKKDSLCSGTNRKLSNILTIVRSDKKVVSKTGSKPLESPHNKKINKKNKKGKQKDSLSRTTMKTAHIVKIDSASIHQQEENLFNEANKISSSLTTYQPFDGTANKVVNKRTHNLLPVKDCQSEFLNKTAKGKVQNTGENATALDARAIPKISSTDTFNRSGSPRKTVDERTKRQIISLPVSNKTTRETRTIGKHQYGFLEDLQGDQKTDCYQTATDFASQTGKTIHENFGKQKCVRYAKTKNCLNDYDMKYNLELPGKFPNHIGTKCLKNRRKMKEKQNFPPKTINHTIGKKTRHVSKAKNMLTNGPIPEKYCNKNDILNECMEQQQNLFNGETDNPEDVPIEIHKLQTYFLDKFDVIMSGVVSMAEHEKKSDNAKMNDFQSFEEKSETVCPSTLLPSITASQVPEDVKQNDNNNNYYESISSSEEENTTVTNNNNSNYVKDVKDDVQVKKTSKLLAEVYGFGSHPPNETGLSITNALSTDDSKNKNNPYFTNSVLVKSTGAMLNPVTHGNPITTSHDYSTLNHIHDQTTSFSESSVRETSVELCFSENETDETLEEVQNVINDFINKERCEYSKENLITSNELHPMNNVNTTSNELQFNTNFKDLRIGNCKIAEVGDHSGANFSGDRSDSKHKSSSDPEIIQSFPQNFGLKKNGNDKEELDEKPKIKVSESVANENPVQSQTEKDVQSQTEKDVQSQTEKDVQSQTEKDVQSQTEKDVQSQTEKDVQSQTEKDVQSQTEKDVQSQTEKDVQSQTEKDVQIGNKNFTIKITESSVDNIVKLNHSKDNAEQKSKHKCQRDQTEHQKKKGAKNSSPEINETIKKIEKRTKIKLKRQKEKNNKKVSKNGEQNPDVLMQHEKKKHLGKAKSITLNTKILINTAKNDKVAKHPAESNKVLKTELIVNVKKDQPKKSSVENNSSDKKRENVEIKNNSSDKKRENVEMKNNSIDKKRENVEIKNNSSDKKRENEEIKNKSSDKKRENVEIKNNSSDKKRENEEIKNKSSDKKRENEEIKNKSSDKKRENEEIKNKSSDKKRENEEIKNKSSDKKRENEEIKNKSSDKKRENEEIKNNPSDKKRENEEIKNNSSDKKRENVEIKNNSSDKKRENVEIKNNSSDKKRENDEIKNNSTSENQSNENLTKPSSKSMSEVKVGVISPEKSEIKRKRGDGDDGNRCKKQRHKDGNGQSSSEGNTNKVPNKLVLKTESDRHTTERSKDLSTQRLKETSKILPVRMTIDSNWDSANEDKHTDVFDKAKKCQSSVTKRKREAGDKMATKKHKKNIAIENGFISPDSEGDDNYSDSARQSAKTGSHQSPGNRTKKSSIKTDKKSAANIPDSKYKSLNPNREEELQDKNSRESTETQSVQKQDDDKRKTIQEEHRSIESKAKENESHCINNLALSSNKQIITQRKSSKHDKIIHDDSVKEKPQYSYSEYTMQPGNTTNECKTDCTPQAFANLLEHIMAEDSSENQDPVTWHSSVIDENELGVNGNSVIDTVTITRTNELSYTSESCQYNPEYRTEQQSSISRNVSKNKYNGDLPLSSLFGIGDKEHLDYPNSTTQTLDNDFSYNSELYEDKSILDDTGWGTGTLIS